LLPPGPPAGTRLGLCVDSAINHIHAHIDPSLFGDWLDGVTMVDGDH
jgi:hypothetical protein